MEYIKVKNEWSWIEGGDEIEVMWKKIIIVKTLRTFNFKYGQDK